MKYTEYMLQNTNTYDTLLTLCASIKNSTVREILSFGTHPEQERQEVDKQENITHLKRKDNS